MVYIMYSATDIALIVVGVLLIMTSYYTYAEGEMFASLPSAIGGYVLLKIGIFDQGFNIMPGSKATPLGLGRY